MIRQEPSRGYCRCGKKVHIIFFMRARGADRVDTKAHDLCQRCWRTLQAQTAAAMFQPKPWWRTVDWQPPMID
jgi:hypothetical protein